MSRFTSKFNKTKKFNVDTTNFTYESLMDLFNAYGKEKVYPLTAIYINTRSQFGDSPVFATDNCFVNAPSHMLGTARDILADEEAVADINNGKVGFEIYSYWSEKFHRICFSINFVDM